MKTYRVNVVYYIQANDEIELEREMKDYGITNSEYYGTHYIEDVEDEEDCTNTCNCYEYNATYTSVWDGGLEISSRCYVDMDEHLIVEMGENDFPESMTETLDTLEDEYVTMDTGERYPAAPKDEMKNFHEIVIGYD